MALTFEFEEEYRDRGFSISQDSFQQKFVFYICGNFYDEALDDPTYGKDDDLVALAAAYTIIPPYRQAPMYSGEQIFLTLDQLEVSQVDNDTWKLEITYSAQNKDQNNQNAGPNVGDRGTWSNNFVQLSFNVTAQEEKKTMSRELMSFRKNSLAPNQTNPYTIGAPAPVGHTAEEIEGYQAYVRGFSFAITAYMTPQQLTFAYVRRLYRMATTVNNKSFFGFPAGSVLFLEAQGSGDVYSTVPVTFDFQMRPNFKFSKDGPEALMDPNVDNEDEMFDTLHDPFFADDPAEGFVTNLPGNAHSGWTLVDYRYAPAPEGGMVLQRPMARFIQRIYPWSNFDRLNL